MASRGPHKHWCKVCNTSFPSGRALGGHMSCHCNRHAGKQPKGTPSPPTIVFDLRVSLLGPCDEKPLLPSLETQCLQCSKVFCTCQALRGHMRIHSQKKVLAMPEEEPAGVMEALANVDGDLGHNEMIFPPVKRKRSKRGVPVLNSKEMDAAVSLLMLAEHSDKTSAYEDCCGGDKDDNSSAPNLLEVNLNAFNHKLVQTEEFTKPKADNNSVYGDFSEHSEKENNLKLFADVPKEEVLLNVFDHGLDGDAEFMKPGADNTVEELKSGGLSAAVNVKRHQCKVCGKVLQSGKALGGHMRLHYVRKCNRQGVADCPDSAMMEEKLQKLESDSELLDFNLPSLIYGDHIHLGVKSESEP